MSTATLMTVEQFAQMRTADTEDYELVEGELIPMSSGTPIHAMVRDDLGYLLGSYFRQNKIGRALAEIDCRVSTNTVRRPDLSVFLGIQAKAFDQTKIPVPYPPDIAIEILSPSEAAVDVNRKALEYLAGGSQEVWQVDTENLEIFVQTATSIRLVRGSELLETPLLPGFSFSIMTIVGAA